MNDLLAQYDEGTIEKLLQYFGGSPKPRQRMFGVNQPIPSHSVPLDTIASHAPPRLRNRAAFDPQYEQDRINMLRFGANAAAFPVTTAMDAAKMH